MITYFPYSQIIVALYDNLKENTTKHSYFGDWNVCENACHEPAPEYLEISEIYY